MRGAFAGMKSNDSSKARKSKAPRRIVRRGVADITKCLRKGQKGLASDVLPTDIIAHLPIICEEKSVAYAYLGSKQLLGNICRSKRVSSALMVMQDMSEVTDESLQPLYEKVDNGIRKVHPYL
eukprot:GHVU01040297.1.p1 GENE.GHVU01040297.1~~GHVU01040297.1.p1  ORF type:complete len:123 (+),score=6.80 GHVU01040297.1:169-537(+)